MAKQAFGGDFNTLAQQYWTQWGEMMRGASAPPPQASTMPGWNEAVGWWSQMAQGGGNEADEAVQRFNTQARGWFGQMQQLAAQFAGRNAGAADIAGAWKQMLGGAGGNPFAEVFSNMGGRGQHGPEQWFQQATPYIEGLQRQASQWLGMPAFGFAREHQERLQKLAQAQVDYQQRSQAYNALMAEAGQAAFAVFEGKLAERSEPGRQLASARALFDLWIDAAEEAYAEIALSPQFREVYGEMVNAQMRLRAAVQGEVEQAGELLGVPTRTEIDAAHRKIVQLERELRRLRDAVAQLTDKAARAGTDSPTKPAPRPDSGRTSRPARGEGKNQGAMHKPAMAANNAAVQPKAPTKPGTNAKTAKTEKRKR